MAAGVMTPGFAKTRQELPWLYYPENDRVIINAHNFGGIWTPAVNGKMPVAAWVPSRDTAGNGTTTLTDLVGSNDGTLTKMDPATDWVADTGKGGVRALEFDGVNDVVIVPNATNINLSEYMISVWIKSPATPSTSLRAIIAKAVADSNGRLNYGITWDHTSATFMATGLHFASSWHAAAPTMASVLAANTWHHIVSTFTGTRLQTYLDSELVGDSAASTPTTGSQPLSIGCGQSQGGSFDQPFSGLIDDVRLFNVSGDASDAADLFTAGRGGHA